MIIVYCALAVSMLATPSSLEVFGQARALTLLQCPMKITWHTKFTTMTTQKYQLVTSNHVQSSENICEQKNQTYVVTPNEKQDDVNVRHQIFSKTTLPASLSSRDLCERSFKMQFLSRPNPPPPIGNKQLSKLVCPKIQT